MKNTAEVIEKWIKKINKRARRDLTEWEKSFMETITEQFSRDCWISNGQEEILERIYAEKTS